MQAEKRRWSQSLSVVTSCDIFSFGPFPVIQSSFSLSLLVMNACTTTQTASLFKSIFLLNVLSPLPHNHCSLEFPSCDYPALFFQPYNLPLGIDDEVRFVYLCLGYSVSRWRPHFKCQYYYAPGGWTQFSHLRDQGPRHTMSRSLYIEPLFNLQQCLDRHEIP